MMSASQALMKAVGTALVAAFAAASQTCHVSVNPAPTRALPICVIGVDTEVESSDKQLPGATMTHTISIFSKSDATTRALCATAVEALVGAKPALASPFYLMGPLRLDLHTTRMDRDERGDVFAGVVRFRAHLSHTTEAA